MNTIQTLENFRLKIQINLLAKDVNKLVSLIGTLKTHEDYNKAIRKGERLKKRADKLSPKIFRHQKKAKYFPRVQQFNTKVKIPLATTMGKFKKEKSQLSLYKTNGYLEEMTKSPNKKLSTPHKAKKPRYTTKKTRIKI